VARPAYHILNGPNLNLLGKREPGLYGHTSFETYWPQLQALFPEAELHYFQSNGEGALIDKLQAWGFSSHGLVLNAGAYTHTSLALADAVAAIESPVVEVHLSNVYAREAVRRHSYLSAHCAGIIAGLGLKGYELALRYLMDEKF